MAFRLSFSEIPQQLPPDGASKPQLANYKALQWV
jgi:hypothetical protein